MRPEKDRMLAESLFVCEGKSCRQIAGIVGAGKETVQRWGREGKWMERRRQRRFDSPLASLERLRRERDRLIGMLGGEPPAKPDNKPDKDVTLQTVTALQRLTQTIEKIESQQELAVGPMLDVFSSFAKFIGTHADAADCAVVRKWTEKFLNEERRKGI